MLSSSWWPLSLAEMVSRKARWRVRCRTFQRFPVALALALGFFSVRTTGTYAIEYL